MTVKKDKSRKIYEDEDTLNRKKRKQYKKTKKRSSWDDEDREDSYDGGHPEDNIYDDSYLDYLSDDDEDDIRQITNINDWVKNN